MHKRMRQDPKILADDFAAEKGSVMRRKRMRQDVKYVQFNEAR